MRTHGGQRSSPTVRLQSKDLPSQMISGRGVELGCVGAVGPSRRSCFDDVMILSKQGVPQQEFPSTSISANWLLTLCM
jgi:hypothetical protein